MNIGTGRILERERHSGWVRPHRIPNEYLLSILVLCWFVPHEECFTFPQVFRGTEEKHVPLFHFVEEVKPRL